MEMDSERKSQALAKRIAPEGALPKKAIGGNELNRAFRMACTAFMAIREYDAQLFQIEEDFDESLENFDTASWINFTLNPDKADALARRTAGALRHATSRMGDAYDKAHKHMLKTLKAVLSAPDELQAQLLGKSYKLSAAEIKSFLKEGMEELTEECYPQSKQYEFFVRVVKDRLERFISRDKIMQLPY
jgi:hypothetical protein